MRLRRDAGGFTLMEVLVVLVITAMISGLLMQALAQVYGLEQRLGLQLQRSQGDAVQEDWFRQIVQQLQPDTPDGPGRLRGDARGFASLGLDPLADNPGIPRQMVLSLRTQGRMTELRLNHAGEDVVLARWEGLSDASFSYQDAKGASHDAWPPPLGPWPTLPVMIQLNLRQDEQQRVLSAVPRSNFERRKSNANALGVFQP